MNAIPTDYAGVRFRSRLEAKWAAFFDLCGLRWMYEPLDLAGYIPDFLLLIPDFLHPKTRPGNWSVVEIKPVVDTEPVDAQQKIDRSGWREDAWVVGVDPDTSWLRLEPGDWSPCPMWAMAQFESEASAERVWREAGNVVQWKAPR